MTTLLAMDCGFWFSGYVVMIMLFKLSLVLLEGSADATLVELV